MRRRARILPGFGLSLGLTVTYMGLVILLPLSMLGLQTATMSWARFWETIASPRALASYRLSLGAALASSAINAVLGLLLAWVLTRYRFPGRRLVDALIDLPFALPTAVAGIALTSLYAGNGWIGGLLAPLGVRVAFTPLGIVLALTFIGLPFVVRTVQPVLMELEPEIEDAALSLGAGRWQVFGRVLLPALTPALITGFGLSFARAVGEYGSIVFISGNMPLRTEITPFLIMAKLEQFDYAGATALAVAMLSLSFALLLGINALQRRVQSAGLLR